MLHSTRSNNEFSFSYCLLKGLANDGGLFVIDNFNKVNVKELINLDYKEIAFIVLKNLIEDFTDDEIKWAIDNAYNKDNFKENIVTIKNFDKYSYLELFNGPTAAFKDFALTILPNLMKIAKDKLNVKEDTRIVVATSGDTGSATLSGFMNKPGFKTTVLYPNNLVSPLQEKQMLLFSEKGNKALAYEGTFDDCQRLCKEIAMDNLKISSANSINIGRLVPQVVYYFYGYVELVKANKIKLGEPINVTVPTGNFGNILSCYIAKNMGLPVNKLICASNENNVLYDFINTGIYNRNRKFIKTYSPSMDILVSSNMERLIYYFYRDTDIVNNKFNEFKKCGIMKIDEYKDLFKDFVSYYALNTEIIDEIKYEFINNKYLIDPHTAVALNATKKYMNEYNDNLFNLIISTASPYKFEDAMKDANIKLDYKYAPLAIKKALNVNKEKTILKNTYNLKEIEDIING